MQPFLCLENYKKSPDALKQAIADINQLEKLTIHYFEPIPKQNMSATCNSIATLLLLILPGVKFCEVKR
jgi:mxaC protein